MKETGMSPMHYEYSFGRFLEQYFYNENKLFMAECGHRALRDVTRKYAVNNSIIVTVQYFAVDVFSIEMIRPKNSDTSELVQNFVEQKRKKIKKDLMDAREDFDTQIQNLLKEIKDARNLILPKDKEQFYAQFNIQFYLDFVR